MEGEALAAAMRKLDRAALTAFVADLWAARGWRVEREGDLLRVRDGDEERLLAVVPATRFGRSLPDRADVIVTTDPDAFVDSDLRVVGPDDLVSMLRYGVPADVGERLCVEHLGAPPDELALPRSVRARRAAGELPLRRAALALVLLAACGALAFTLPLNDLFGPENATAEPAAEPAGEPALNVTPLPAGNRTYTAAELVAAHRGALNGSAYQLSVTRIRSEPEPGEARIGTRTVSVDGERVRVNVGGVGLPGTVSGRELYLDGSAGFEATYRNRSFHYRRLPEPGDPVEASFTALEHHLSTPTLGTRGVVAREEGRRTLVVGRGIPKSSNATNYSVEAFLGREGFLHRVVAEYTRPAGGTVRVTWAFRTVEPGTIDPPLWYEREFRVGSAAELNSRGS